MNIKENHKYFWSPSVKWEQHVNEVKIEVFVYKDFVPSLFPSFFFLSQKGISFSEITSTFSNVPAQSLKMFFIDLVKKRILVKNVLTPQELYFSQNTFHQHNYPESIKFDESDLEKFKQQQLSRQYFPENTQVIKLLKDNNIPTVIKKRQTYRRFKEDEMISFERFSNFLSVLKQLKQKGETRYYYGSAGGLYPIDIYLHIKPERIERIGEGIYYFNPIENCILFINTGSRIVKDCHFYTNQNIFESSAFSVFFVYNCDVTMPKYGGMGYYFAGIDTGIMVSTLTYMAEMNNLGVCSIGDMNFKKIETDFQLMDHQVFLHALEVGLKV